MANANRNSTSTKTFSKSYYDGFTAWIKGGTDISAMSEGELATGGFSVPYKVADSIMPLGPQDSAIRRLATVIETTEDIVYPVAISAVQAAAKAESGPVLGAFSSVNFGNLAGVRLSAFTVGLQDTISFEAGSDILGLRSYLEGESIFAVDAYEEGKFLNGSGVGEPQGILGNVGAGVTGVVAGSDNYASELLTATFDVLAELKAVYHSGATWLMARATARNLRKAARANNDPAFTRENGQDYLHGYPVEYSESMPAIAPGATPVLFGSVAAAYIIGDRNGSGLNVKLLDQVLAAQGLLQFIAFRRTDGRVRRAEAIQPIVLHS